MKYTTMLNEDGLTIIIVRKDDDKLVKIEISQDDKYLGTFWADKEAK